MIKLYLLTTAMTACFISPALHGQTTSPFLGYKSIREFGITPENSAALNTVQLQKAIDWASPRGAALFVDPSEEPYPLDGGILLRRNVSLIGVHGPVPRGTRHPKKPQPVGSVFRIEDEKNVFLTMEGATQLRGLQFWYPRQTRTDPKKIIEYPATIQIGKRGPRTEGVTLSCLTFFGEFTTMDFRAEPNHPGELILFEHCYGYPLSGEFIKIDYCYDIPRILHCHVNPGLRRQIDGDAAPAIIDSVVARKTFTYSIDHTDNAQLMDVFVFGTYGGIHLGAHTYGQLTNFNLDCVTIGILKQGQQNFNRNWQISQGSIIANTAPSVDLIHPIIIEGKGHTSIVGVEAFSGQNPVLTCIGKSQDFLLVRGKEKTTVSLYGCRMRNYVADSPITNENPNAVIQAHACIDTQERPFNLNVNVK